MESHFIKETNKQYSIREDGAVIINYKHYKGRIIILTNRLCKTYSPANSSKYVVMMKDKKRKSTSISPLLKEYFGYYYCSKCNQKTCDDSTYTCKKCVRLEDQIRNSKYTKLHSKEIKAVNKIKRDAITKSYVACLLLLPIKDLTEELYQLHKITLKTKRLCKTIKN